MGPKAYPAQRVKLLNRKSRTADADKGRCAVYYALSDCPSFLRRLLAAMIDAAVILALATAINAAIPDMTFPRAPTAELLGQYQSGRILQGCARRSTSQSV